MIIPTLHCEIGLINKIEESFEDWAHLAVVGLSAKEHGIRNDFLEARDLEFQLEERKEDSSQAWKAYQEQRKVREAASKRYDKMILAYSSTKDSFCSAREDLYRKIGMKHESYFAGKLNGKSAHAMMEHAAEYSKGLQKIILSLYDPQQSKLTAAMVTERIKCYEKLLGCLDALFAHVRGPNTGLLPSKADIQNLEKIIKITRTAWYQCGLSTLQPKWHIIFDGHLLEQVRSHFGLADKIDDFIEKAHQPWKREKERTWGITSFELQQKCQLKAVRKRKHYKIDLKIQENARKRKRVFKTDFEEKARNKMAAAEEAKQARRQKYLMED